MRPQRRCGCVVVCAIIGVASRPIEMLGACRERRAKQPIAVPRGSIALAAGLELAHLPHAETDPRGELGLGELRDVRAA